MNAKETCTEKEKKIILSATHIQKFYGHVTALEDGNLTLYQGEIHALLGDNGAGKSTLIKIISGAVPKSRGEVILDGQAVDFKTPREARNSGIETVYQDLSLATTLPVGENIFLRAEIMRPGILGRLGFVDRLRMKEESRNILDKLGATIPSYRNEVGAMSGGQMQAVAIARAVKWGEKLIIMDEPTAALGVRQRESVLHLLENLKVSKQVTVLLITHNMHDVFRVADRVTILHQGRTVLNGGEIEKLTMEDVISYMTGAKEDRAMGQESWEGRGSNGAL